MMRDENVLSYSSLPRTRGRKRLWSAFVGLIVIPVTYLIAIYSAWILAWFQLGHRPITGPDDPKQFEGATEALYLTWCAIEYFGFWKHWINFVIPALVFLAIVIAVNSAQGRRRWWFLGFACALWLMLIIQRWIDPFRVLYWAYD